MKKNVFNSFLDPNKFDFVELVPDNAFINSINPNWFKAACDSKIQGDVLILSGHFGGSFFGSSGVSLSASEIERYSCTNECSGVLSYPTEVFLFGCNTLADKEQDHRTPAEYLRVLIQDDIPRATAEQVVAARYSAVYGSSMSDRMQRIFNGVPKIYGFSSVAPSGKNIKPLLQRYHKTIPDYATHLDRLAVHGALQLPQAKIVLDSKSDSTCSSCISHSSSHRSTNQKLIQALKGQAFVKKSGILDENRELICKIHDTEQPLEA